MIRALYILALVAETEVIKQINRHAKAISSAKIAMPGPIPDNLRAVWQIFVFLVESLHLSNPPAWH